MEIDLTDCKSLKNLEVKIEKERVRLFGWSKVFKDRGAEKEKEIYLHRCRRLAKIRENLKLLAETYE